MDKRKRICAALLLAALLSVPAYAEQPQTEVANKDGGTSIAITDITPREESGNDSQEKFLRSYYPVEIKTAEDGGVRLLVKTYVVPKTVSPQTLIEEGLTRRGVSYEVSDILRMELKDTAETKSALQTVTVPSDTDKTDELLSILAPTLEYSADGFSGTLTLDQNSIKAKASDSQSYAYPIKDTREYTGLDRNDPYYIPKTADKNGITLKLADVQWTPMGSAADNSETPALFRATAVYTGSAWGSKTTGYTVTAAYTGEIVKITEGDVVYSIVYEEIPKASAFAGMGAINWKPALLGVLLLIILGAAAFAVLWLVRRGRTAAESQKEMAYADPYAGRPPMDLPDILDEMDRGLEDDDR